MLCQLHWALYQENLNVHCWMFFFLSWWNYSQLQFNWTEYYYIYIYIYILCCRLAFRDISYILIYTEYVFPLFLTRQKEFGVVLTENLVKKVKFTLNSNTKSLSFPWWNGKSAGLRNSNVRVYIPVALLHSLSN